MIYLLNGQVINGKQFTINGKTYPSNWCDIVTESDRSALGIVTLTIVKPTLSDNQQYNGYTDDLTAKTRTFNVITLVYPTLVTNQQYDGTYVDNTTTHTRTFNVVTITPSVPVQIPLWKLRSELASLSMLDSVNTAISSLSEPNKTYAENGFNYASSIERNSGVVSLIQAVLALSGSQVDDIFKNADAITA